MLRKIAGSLILLLIFGGMFTVYVAAYGFIETILAFCVIFIVFLLLALATHLLMDD